MRKTTSVVPISGGLTYYKRREWSAATSEDGQVDSGYLKVPKTNKPVTLWVHPEGRVPGALFVHEHSQVHSGAEDPYELINGEDPFVIVRRDDGPEIRFYNRSAVVRIEYAVEAPPPVEVAPLHCRLVLMDGSEISGTICEPLPPDRSRLVDYLNRADLRFIRIVAEPNQAMLINKQYIVHAAEFDSDADAD